MGTQDKQSTSRDFPPIQQEVRLRFEYPVHFTRHLFDCGNPLLGSVLGSGAGHEAHFPQRTLCIIDRDVARLHGNLVARIKHYFAEVAFHAPLAGEPLLLAGGEAAKNSEDATRQILHQINEQDLCRQSCLLAIGGGALIDTVGFAAAIAHRGIPIVRVPTTVLAQNDASLAVKNGINAYGQKNFLGTFTPPRAVLCDRDFLTTLSDRDWRAGIAEAIKVALLRDSAFFADIEANAPALVGRDMDAMSDLIYRCARLHLAHIAGGDPFELGSSRPLDFGHWAAHKIESLSHHQLRHGEAVAMGLALDTVYATLARLLAEADCRRILQTIEAVKLPLYSGLMHDHLDDIGHSRCLLGGLEEFRRHLGGELTVMLIAGIGREHEVHSINIGLMRQAVDRLRDLNANSNRQAGIPTTSPATTPDHDNITP